MTIELQMSADLPEKSRKVRTSKYPINEMQPGHSFFVQGDDAYKKLCTQAAAANARYAVPHPEGKTKLNKKGESVVVGLRTRFFEVRLSADPIGAHLLRVR
jgi:hypothetical protein